MEISVYWSCGAPLQVIEILRPPCGGRKSPDMNALLHHLQENYDEQQLRVLSDSLWASDLAPE